MTAVRNATNRGKPTVARRCLANRLARSARPYSSPVGADRRGSVTPGSDVPTDVATFSSTLSVPAVCGRVPGQHSYRGTDSKVNYEDYLTETDLCDATRPGGTNSWSSLGRRLPQPDLSLVSTDTRRKHDR